MQKKVMFVSQFARQNSFVYKDLADAKIMVLHNLVDDSFFQEKIREKKENAIAIGDFSPRKNQLFLLDVWEKVRKEKPDAKLIFAGNGFEDPSFSNAVAHKKISDGIVVTPRLNRTEVVERIASSVILLSASKSETFGLTIAEALALGVPVVVSDSGGPRDIVENGDGFLIEPEATEKFAGSIISVLEGKCDNPETIRERCREKFGEASIMKSLMEVYNSL